MKKKVVLAVFMVLCLALSGCGQAAKKVYSKDKVVKRKVNSVQAKTYPVFDLDKKSVKLNNGYNMPILGLGMFSLSESEAENSTYLALKAGFRLIDTAKIYGNEAAVGRGLRRAIADGIVSRKDVFITTKMWT